MKRILIPVDGSDAALRAVKVAIEAATGSKTMPDVRLVTVQAPILSGNVTRFFTAEMIESYYQEEGEKTLAGARKMLNDAAIEHQDKVLVGHVAQAITQYAEEESCDHIFMGTRGLGAVTSVVLGSVTHKVIAMSRVPVTLVP